MELTNILNTYNRRINTNKTDSDHFFNKIEEGELRLIYNDIKKNLRNPNTYKWSIKKAVDFITVKKLNSVLLINFLDDFFTYYFNVFNKKGSQETFKFLNLLKTSPYLQKHCGKQKLILKNINELNNFLEEITTLKANYLDVSHENFIRFISSNFTTQKSYGTLRRLYFDNKISE
jgi:hypothetical protein